LIIIVLSLSLRFSFLAPESSFSRRSQLAAISVKMISKRPLTGVGLNNFTAVMDQYGYVPGAVRFLQPVHNLFLLIFAETGLIGLAGFVYLFFKSPFWRSQVGPYWIILFLGLFDHYFFTLQQGLLLLTICLACNFNSLRKSQ
ncbi:MAG: O-antigen ligase family protein, partial [Candidatus Beckwithbacteria bacterium]